MHYVLFAPDDDNDIMMTGALAAQDASFLKETVVPALKPLADDDYLNGPAGILHTAARSSYVMDGEVVYWCIEWVPGLLVLRFAPNEGVSHAVFTSPNPGFGGREATDREWEGYDEDAHDPLYSIVFTAWDAIFEPDKLSTFTEADAAVQEKWRAAFAHVETLSAKLHEELGDNRKKFDKWIARCQESELWKGGRID